MPRQPRRPLREDRERMCTRKRRYASAADALDAVRILGLERQRQAYHCSLCGKWHLTSR